MSNLPEAETQGSPAVPPKPAAKPAPRDPSKTAPAVASKVKGDDTLLTSRRRVVWSCVIGYLGANFLMFLRFFFPRALFEPKTVFKIGYPSDFSLGVDTKFQKDHRIWVVKTASRLFVIYARCVHLGCTPDWKASENKFKCPCHGSGYDSEGINFEGPAPRPMDRCRVSIDPTGEIVVDTNKLFQWPKGGTDEFEQADAYIKL
jgi:cytochrome b6-f complex iron-sulfur subunit